MAPARLTIPPAARPLASAPRLTYIGGPTVLLEWGALRLLTDPTFDPPGTRYPTAYPTGTCVLRKTLGPAVAPEALGRIDAVLLSHDQHADNLDHAGRAVLLRAGVVLTTPEGAARLGGRAVGLPAWGEFDLIAGDRRVLRVTGAPARHGPAHLDRGPVTGFVLRFLDDPGAALYVSGDTVWFEGVAEVAARFAVRAAVLHMGAARVPAVGPWPLTFTAADGAAAARAFADATVVPVHYEGWEHLPESRAEIESAFAAAGLAPRLRWLPPGRPVEVFDVRDQPLPSRTPAA